MICLVGLGSNLGSSKENIEKAAKALRDLSVSYFKISPIYKTAAVVPENAPNDWNKPYFNAVAKIKWDGSASQLLAELKMLETKIGRIPAPRWAPRIIDLDLLTFGEVIIKKPTLQVPHNRITDRSFVLDPMKDLVPMLQIPDTENLVVNLARNSKGHQPLIMGILNMTPDSFSDGHDHINFSGKILEMDQLGVHIIDIGAESTRPNAKAISAHEEWLRLEPVLIYIHDAFKNRLVKPIISVDTYKAVVAKKALDLGDVSIINDVSGLQDPQMLNLLSQTSCDYILMHNLGLPANPHLTLPADCDPVAEIKSWLNKKLELLSAHNINFDRIIFDLGIGFGKTAEQSLTLIKRVNEFSDLPLRILIGHSRKSFMKSWGLEKPNDRDVSTLFLSKQLVAKGVDILRVHDYQSHMKAFL